jgi:hypothetical protein
MFLSQIGVKACLIIHGYNVHSKEMAIARVLKQQRMKYFMAARIMILN